MFPQANGFFHANLTLQDPECKATVNATHYTLETPLTGCQTTVYLMQGSPMALHINSVSILPVMAAALLTPAHSCSLLLTLTCTALFSLVKVCCSCGKKVGTCPKTFSSFVD